MWIKFDHVLCKLIAVFPISSWNCVKFVQKQKTKQKTHTKLCKFVLNHRIIQKAHRLLGAKILLYPVPFKVWG